MNKQYSIPCSAHDHLEVACLFRYDLTVLLADGERIDGRAVTTRTEKGGIEYLVLTVDGTTTDIRMSDIASITVLTPGARFEHVEIGQLEI